MADEQLPTPDIPEASDVVDAEGGPKVSPRRSLSGATAIMASGTLGVSLAWVCPHGIAHMGNPGHRLQR